MGRKTAAKRENAERNVRWAIERYGVVIRDRKNDGWHLLVETPDGRLWDFWPSSCKLREKLPGADVRQGRGAVNQLWRKAQRAAPTPKNPQAQPQPAIVADSQIGRCLRAVAACLTQDPPQLEDALAVIYQTIGTPAEALATLKDTTR